MLLKFDLLIIHDDLGEIKVKFTLIETSSGESFHYGNECVYNLSWCGSRCEGDQPGHGLSMVLTDNGR